MQWKTFYKKEEFKLKKNEDKNLSFLLKTTTDCKFLSQNLRPFLIKKFYFLVYIFEYIETVVRRSSVKKVFLEISLNSQENSCARVFFFNKVAGLRPVTLLRKRLWQRCLPVNFARFLRTPFSQNTSGRLLL